MPKYKFSITFNSYIHMTIDSSNSLQTNNQRSKTKRKLKTLLEKSEYLLLTYKELTFHSIKKLSNSLVPHQTTEI